MNNGLLKKGWVFSNIKGIREASDAGTYYHFDYNQLPPIELNLDDGFNWMKPYPEWFGDNDLEYNFRLQLDKLNHDAKKKGFKLPDSFNVFMGNPEFMRRIRSNTDCYFELGDIVEEVPNSNGLHMIHFMSDSQYCAFWYLCLDEKGNHFVVNSQNFYGHKDEEYQIFKEDNDESEIGFICAENFKEFIFRFWIENEIWMKEIYEKEELNELEKKYADHYRM